MGDVDLFGEPVVNGHKSVLAQTFEYPPFSVLNAREGWWQERKRQWLALGIESELGRGGAGEPGGSARPACDYSNRERGDGAGRAMPSSRGGGNGMMAFDNRHGLQGWSAAKKAEAARD